MVVAAITYFNGLLIKQSQLKIETEIELLEEQLLEPTETEEDHQPNPDTIYQVGNHNPSLPTKHKSLAKE